VPFFEQVNNLLYVSPRSTGFQPVPFSEQVDNLLYVPPT
jgi:hypothetical protein